MALNYGLTQTGTMRHIIVRSGFPKHLSYCGRLVKALPPNDQGREAVCESCQVIYDHWQKADAPSAASGGAS